MQPSFAIAVKALIVSDNKILVMKRSEDAAHAPGAWDIPGGRLDHGEDPFLGLQREVQEETGLSIDIDEPLRVHHFTRDDGQAITMITFLCHPHTKDVTLSHEHTEEKWVPVDDATSLLREDLAGEIAVYKKRYNGPD